MHEPEEDVGVLQTGGCGLTHILHVSCNSSDLDECAHNNGGCEGLCVNHVEGYYCSCPCNQRLKDGYRCENCKLPFYIYIYVTFKNLLPPLYTSVDNGLVCASQTCNNTGCQQKSVSYCGDSTGRSQYCQVSVPPPIIYNYIGWIVTPLHCTIKNFACILYCITEGKVVSPVKGQLLNRI